MILEILAYGFFSAFGWWTANHFIIEPHFPPPMERTQEKTHDQESKKSGS